MIPDGVCYSKMASHETHETHRTTRTPSEWAAFDTAAAITREKMGGLIVRAGGNVRGSTSAVAKLRKQLTSGYPIKDPAVFREAFNIMRLADLRPHDRKALEDLESLPEPELLAQVHHHPGEFARADAAIRALADRPKSEHLEALIALKAEVENVYGLANVFSGDEMGDFFKSLATTPAAAEFLLAWVRAAARPLQFLGLAQDACTGASSREFYSALQAMHLTFEDVHVNLSEVDRLEVPGADLRRDADLRRGTALTSCPKLRWRDLEVPDLFPGFLAANLNWRVRQLLMLGRSEVDAFLRWAAPRRADMLADPSAAVMLVGLQKHNICEADRQALIDFGYPFGGAAEC